MRTTREEEPRARRRHGKHEAEVESLVDRVRGRELLLQLADPGDLVLKVLFPSVVFDKLDGRQHLLQDGSPAKQVKSVFNSVSTCTASTCTDQSVEDLRPQNRAGLAC